MAKSDRVNPHSEIAMANEMGYFPPETDRLTIQGVCADIAFEKGYFSSGRKSGAIGDEHWRECTRLAIERLYGTPRSSLQTAGDLMARYENRKLPTRWGIWSYNPARCLATADESAGRGFAITLESVLSRDSVLEWLTHMHEKAWCRGETFADLFAAFNDIFGLSMGGKFDNARRLAGYEHRAGIAGRKWEDWEAD